MNYLSKENVQEVLDLSLLQTKIYSQENPEQAELHIAQVRLQLSGALDPAKFAAAVQHVIAQNPLLRTVFRPVRGRVVQVLLKNRPIDVAVLDLTGQDAVAQAAALDQAAREARAPFHLNEGPLLRVSLVVLDAERAVALWTHHGMILDETSRRLLQAELLTAYDALVSGTALPTANRSSFKDYLNWLNAQDRSAAREFWSQHLAGFEAATPLLNQREGDGEPGVRARAFSAELSRALEALAQAQGVKAETLVQAAWAFLLNLYSREDAVTFGAGFTGRPATLSGAEAMVGRFANTLPLHLAVDGETEVAEFLRQLDGLTATMESFAVIPLAEVRNYAGLGEQQELFTSAVNVYAGAASAAGVLRTELAAKQEGAGLALALDVETGETWIARAAFSGDRLSGETAEALLTHLETVLASMTLLPHARIRELNVLPSTEREPLFGAFTATRLQAYPLDRLAHQVIEDQVAKTPEQIAAIFEGAQITYAELNARANRLAHFLRENGFGRDDLAALFAERGIDMLTAIVAVMKAGGAYVPLDSAHPDARLSTIIETAGAKVILTQGPLLERSRGLSDQALVFSLDELDGLANYPDVNLEFVNVPHDLANVFFTSGSTGLPKGAMVEHVGMLNHLYAKIDLLELTSSSIVVQNASHCFDISVWQFLAPLMVGGTVVIYGNDIAMDPNALLASVQRDNVTILEMVPAVIEMFLQAVAEHAEAAALPELRYMLSTGEGLRSGLCERWLEAYPHVKAVNTYGATECSDDTSHKVVTAANRDEWDLDRDFVTLGTPIPNFNVYVLDKWNRPVPIGCTGEICMTGVGVGRGYLNDPERTAQAFVPNPFDDGRGERMYKTGDLGRFLPDGRLEFVSRADFQVKVRGHRIELGEVEAAILSHPSAEQTIAIVRPDSAGQNRILAYVIVSEAVDMDAWREYLHDRLPEYMIPEHILTLDSFPLNRNGKIDRKALPEPEAAERGAHAFAAPRNELEQALADIWGEILERGDIGIDDSFFHLGGHSLKMIQIRSRIKQKLGLDVPLKVLFENLTLRDLAPHVGLLQGEDGVSQTIPALPDAEFYPMSHAQRRLYFIQRLTPANTAYNMLEAHEVAGEMNRDALVRAFQTIIDRHAVLRTTFTMQDGEPVQQIAASVQLNVPLEDLSALPEAEREAELHARILAEQDLPFDLEQGPVIRLRLLKLAELRHVLLISKHHIVTDFWSWGVLHQEFYALYTAYANGEDSPLSPLPIQYRDYASWQNDRLHTGQLAESEAYWKQQLSGDLPVLDLPTDHPRPALQQFAGQNIRRLLDGELSGRIHELGARHEATLFMVLLGALGTFLSRMSGQQDIVIGTPEAGRNVMELEELIGFFINTLPLRLDLSGNPAFAEMLERAKQVALDAYAHHEYPFDKLVELAKQERDLSRSPLFSVMFQVVRRPDQVETGGLSLSPVPMSATTTAFDLAVTFVEREEGLELNFDYRSDLFEQATMERWMGHFETLLRAIVAQPEQQLAQLQLLTSADLAPVLGAWNQISAEPDPMLRIHHLFEAQVDRTPDATAVVCAGESLTYRELNARANRLARYLQSLGAGPEKLVGLCLDRNLDLVTALLAVLKAGSAFVPLDPAYPQERLALILEDTSMPLLVTGTSLIAMLPPHGAQTVLIDADREKWAGEADGNVPSPVRPDSLAYLIYTSGSTGRPKAVMVEHRHLIATLLASQQHFRFSQNDVFPWIASFAFDIAYFELLNPLIAGGTSVVLSKDHLLDLPGLVCDLEGYTMIHTVPSLMRQIVEMIASQEIDTTRFDGLRMIFIGGDAVPPELLNIMHRTFRNAEVRVLYGPTEAAIICAQYPVPRGAKMERFMIGSSMNHAKIRIYDAHGNLVPTGVPGELYIGGCGVSRGYFGRPELTAAQFVVLDGERWYKSGDLARYMADGTIDFLGRIDNQIKIRGFRIELGEIEAALGKHPSISEVVVLAREINQGDKQLVAYVSPKENAALSSAELRSALQAHLPEHMVPSFFVLLDAMPMTPTGKIDRKQLPLPQTAGESSYAAPRDGVELALAQVFEEVLGTSGVGLYDNFFEIGGHSLKAVALIEAIRKRCGVSVPLTALFQAPTVANLGRILRGEQAADRQVVLVLLQKGDNTRPPLFLLPPQGGGVMSYLPLVKGLDGETVYGLQSAGFESDETPFSTMEAISERFLAEIRSVQPEGPYRLAGWSFGGVAAYDLALRLEGQGQEVEFLGLFDVMPIDPDNGEAHAQAQTEEVALLHQAAQLDMDLSLVQGLPVEEGLDLVLRRADELNRLPEGTTPESMRQKMRVMINNGIAGFSYVPPGKVRADLTLFRCSEEPKQPELAHPLVDPELWSPYTLGAVNVIPVPGDHHSLFHPPHVHKLAEQMKPLLRVVIRAGQEV
ncbi:amino acid adenylation domain-containing protein [Tumebacillus sp. BK434]|uniref:amino acid adenylation domain-containing protein n=1 Tax=Tumebacillus sp. BK434 TaxID=2512169 RepID=UPI00104EEDEB|nr:non-ribosomal peptide synthetase [Tumebacillus sp. BK434]TCP59166.1 amino acid adenylation domain-containing protein [Tumebacillus sp. BK434]